mmetsp:Transcript_33483/g.96099  ORF Transcript_33483/g.96099 Transcript_33483/m.96099 type:complete len:202 (-) Transcript_33483:433-1038(-)
MPMAANWRLCAGANALPASSDDARPDGMDQRGGDAACAADACRARVHHDAGLPRCPGRCAPDQPGADARHAPDAVVRDPAAAGHGSGGCYSRRRRVGPDRDGHSADDSVWHAGVGRTTGCRNGNGPAGASELGGAGKRGRHSPRHELAGARAGDGRHRLPLVGGPRRCCPSVRRRAAAAGGDAAEPGGVGGDAQTGDAGSL